MPKIAPDVQSGEGRSGTPPARSNFSDRLSQLEAEIRNGQANYAVVGSALTEIQSSRLYKPQYNTFEEYCEKQWGFSRSTAYEYISAFGVSQNVRISGQNLGFQQAVELARIINPEQQKEVASRIDFTSATVKDVKKAVDGALGKEPAPEPKEGKEIPLEEVLDALVTKIVMQPYGCHAAKFAAYAAQHPSELKVIALAKKDVYQQIEKICQTQTCS